MLLKTLSDSGVNIKYIKMLDTANGHAVIQVSEKGENSIFLYPGSNSRITVDFADYVLEQFGVGDIEIAFHKIHRGNKKEMTQILIKG